MIPDPTLSGAAWFIGASWFTTAVIYGGAKLYKKSQSNLEDDSYWINVDHVRRVQDAAYGPPTMANMEEVNPVTVIPGEVVDLSESRIPEIPSWMK